MCSRFSKSRGDKGSLLPPRIMCLLSTCGPLRRILKCAHTLPPRGSSSAASLCPSNASCHSYAQNHTLLQASRAVFAVAAHLRSHITSHRADSAERWQCSVVEAEAVW
mmetsp:Transcript_20538/g.30597  ORF Transcript_20538/g.30597 Transcript_20538/m.30597 type:complete len:108 (-) Transcript_20538:185-508(-)